jgi:cysteinyl-tRNA synthetase
MRIAWMQSADLFFTDAPTVRLYNACMPFRLYNTLTKCEEDFVPLDPKGKVVAMYTCGPTVYGRPHVGNYASFLMADLLRRWLEAGHGHQVRHVKNITDVGHLLHDADHGDDKIQKQAEKEKIHPLEVARRYEEEFLADERALNILEPERRPRASEFITEQLSIIRTLLQKGHAYETDDGVYFDVTSKTPTLYGTLSGNTLKELDAGARVEVDERKKHPADFALWKKCIGDNAAHILRWKFSSGEVSKSTGEDLSSGFPGWHIECSAMSSAILGDQIDLHTGGEDNIFPHHECEIAQSESSSGKVPFVRYWIHRRRIQMGEVKMSKSLGNILTLPDIVAEGFSPMDLRYYLLSVHYRTNLKFTAEGLDGARGVRRSIVEWLSRNGTGAYAAIGMWPHDPVASDINKFTEDFVEAMNDDLNVSAALAAVHGCMNYMNSHAVPSGDADESLGKFIGLIRHTFGCFEPEEEAIGADALQCARERDEARKNKDFLASDRLRDQLMAMGYEVRDTPEGTKLRRR